MAQPMPADNPFLNFPYGPVRMECDANDLIIEGEIPEEISGSLYRNGPNQRFAPRGDYHLFAGDGMIHAFHINNGQVDYKNRWVKTAKWNVEDREGRNLVNPMNPFDCDPDYSDFIFTDKDGLANTAVVWHAGRLLALEEGHPPYEVDPVTLESIGSWNFRGKLQTAMTAHPKVDPATGEMVFFAYMASGPFASDVAVHKVDQEGKLTESLVIPTPYPSMVHDFVLTENYIIVPIMPITGSLDRAMEGKPPFAWEPEKGVHVGVIPRHGGTADDVRWIEMDTSFVFHFMNGFDQSDVITIDCCLFDHAPLFPTADGTETGEARPFLTRLTIDLNDPNARVNQTDVGNIESEFPICDTRFICKEYRHGWYTSPDGNLPSTLPNSSHFYNMIGHIDHQTGTAQSYSFGQSLPSEPLYVPKSKDAAEGDGYILTVVTHFDTRTSSLCILDALNLKQGPIAQAHLSHCVPSGFHGLWRQAD